MNTAPRLRVVRFRRSSQQDQIQRIALRLARIQKGNPEFLTEFEKLIDWLMIKPKNNIGDDDRPGA
ncbi:MAG TPA: hypothetical protein VI485_28775 [Vicinamibacterales bacterium]|nr:hypothetical protein [Vicinamibacterales bacterium]